MPLFCCSLLFNLNLNLNLAISLTISSFILNNQYSETKKAEVPLETSAKSIIYFKISALRYHGASERVKNSLPPRLYLFLRQS